MAQREIVYNNKHFALAYEVCNHEKSDEILFLHGWGSNKELMKRCFHAHFMEFKQIYIDLPGFGKSQNTEVLCTLDYAEIIRAFLKSIKSNPDIIIAHSFGGKIATLLAPRRLVLLSSAGILPKKSLKTRMKILLAKILRHVKLHNLARLLRARDVLNMPQNMYETFKRVVDEDFTKHFMQFDGTAYIFWGEDDEATPLASGKKIASLIPKSLLFVLKGDHFFFIKHAQEIAKIITKGNILNLYKFTITGKVQGVGYRKFAQQCAHTLNIKGTVRNLPDGSVELFALLDDERKGSFLAKLNEGPKLASVENIEESRYDSHDSLLESFQSFKILY